MGYLGCGVFGMWDVGDLECLGCEIFWMRKVRDVGCVGCLACGMLGILDVKDARCSGCGMFRMWDVECLLGCGMLVYKMPKKLEYHGIRAINNSWFQHGDIILNRSNNSVFLRLKIYLNRQVFDLIRASGI